ncbi:17820_t:CDS:2, partial [Funneliformis geosporum]
AAAAFRNQAGIQPRPDGIQNPSNQNNNTNNNAPPHSSTSEQQNNNNNEDGANHIAVPPQDNGRSVSLQDIEHALWTFVASLIPTNTPDVAQQDDVVGM